MFNNLIFEGRGKFCLTPRFIEMEFFFIQNVRIKDGFFLDIYQTKNEINDIYLDNC